MTARPSTPKRSKLNIERMQTMKESKRKVRAVADQARSRSLTRRPCVLKLETPFAPLLSVLTDRAGMMVSPSAGTSTDEFAANPVCSGPYQFESRSARDKISLKKYPGYWNADKIGYDAIEYPTSPTRPCACRASRPATSMSPSASHRPTWRQSRSNSDLALYTSAGLAVSHLFINVRRGLRRRRSADKPDLRQALELSLDRNVINQVAFNGEFTRRQPDDPALQRLLQRQAPDAGPRRRRGQDADRRTRASRTRPSRSPTRTR